MYPSGLRYAWTENFHLPVFRPSNLPYVKNQVRFPCSRAQFFLTQFLEHANIVFALAETFLDRYKASLCRNTRYLSLYEKRESSAITFPEYNQMFCKQYPHLKISITEER